MKSRRIGSSCLLLVVLATSCAADGSPSTEGATTTEPSPAPSMTAPAAAGATAVSPPTTVESTTAPPNSLTYVDADDSVLAVVAARDDTTRFVQLAATLDDDVFRQERGITLLVPVDSAWDAFGQDEFDALLADPDAVALLLSEHLAVGVFTADELTAMGGLATAMARTLPVAESDGVITIGGATVVEADLVADNGVAHLIDAVIVP